MCRWDINSKADKNRIGALKDCNVKGWPRVSSPAGFANRNNYTLVFTKRVEFTDQLRRYILPEIMCKVELIVGV